MTSNAFDPIALIRTVLGSRAFALADAPPDAELCALLHLGETAAAAGPNVAVALSTITTPRVRSLFEGRQTTSFRATSGLRFTVDGGDIFAATVAAGYMPESRDFEAFMQLVRPGSVIVDVGANFGLYALSAAIYARPVGRVFAFEPAPDVFALLERNISENDLSALVTAKPFAVAAAAGKAEFYVGRDVSFSSLHRTTRVDESASAVEVDVVTLDSALSQLQSIDLLKIDVEGGEGNVLRGARELLRRSRAPIVQFEFSHKNLDEARRQAFDETIALLAGDGFRIYRRGVSGPVTLPNTSEAFSGNLFLARDGEGRERLQRALQRTDNERANARDIGALALLRLIAEQHEALQHAELLQREAIQVADSIVGDHVTGGSEAVRAMQQAWLETRKRAMDAENQVNTLSASVEGRDRLVEQTQEKLASWREIDRKLRARVDLLETTIKTLQEKIAAGRTENDDMRRRLKVSEAKREHLIKVTKRLQERCETLIAQLGDDAPVAQPSEDETTSS